MILFRFLCLFGIFFFNRQTAYEMRISDWSSDVCSSDRHRREDRPDRTGQRRYSCRHSVTKAEVCENFTLQSAVAIGKLHARWVHDHPPGAPPRHRHRRTDMTIHATPGSAPLRAGDQTQTAAQLQEIWDTDPRWDGDRKS